MLELQIGGVPEHFNHPVKMAISQGLFDEIGIKASWTDYHGGTGQMNKALREGKADICILLTEGIIKDILKGNPSRLISIYVNTPLCWGIHTGSGNSLESYSQIWDKKFAVSRYGSGSHLMPLVDANIKDKEIDEEQFVVVNNLGSALESLREETTDVFYWEKYTTKPYVQDGRLRRIGEFYSPWPCFVMAAREEFLKMYPLETRKILELIHRSCDGFMRRSDAPQIIADNYNLEPEDARRWFHSTEWAVHGWISNKMIDGVLYNLRLAGLIGTEGTPADLIWANKNPA